MEALFLGFRLPHDGFGVRCRVGRERGQVNARPEKPFCGCDNYFIFYYDLLIKACVHTSEHCLSSNPLALRVYAQVCVCIYRRRLYADPQPQRRRWTGRPPDCIRARLTRCGSVPAPCASTVHMNDVSSVHVRDFVSKNTAHKWWWGGKSSCV